MFFFKNLIKIKQTNYENKNKNKKIIFYIAKIFFFYFLLKIIKSYHFKLSLMGLNVKFFFEKKKKKITK